MTHIILAQFAKLYSHYSTPLIQNGMRLGGFLLLLSGWGIVVAALVMLRGGAVSGFILAGFGVEIIGLVLVMRAHLPGSEDEG
jgi:hypothetical protein